MMATAAAARPNAAAFASCQWFQEDMLLRALRFLDGILQRESSQKVGLGWGSAWCLVSGVWCLVCGVWCVVYGVWTTQSWSVLCSTSY